MKITCPQCGKLVSGPSIILVNNITCPSCNYLIPLNEGKSVSSDTQKQASSETRSSTVTREPSVSAEIVVCLFCKEENRGGGQVCAVCGADLLKQKEVGNIPSLRMNRRYATILAILDGLGTTKDFPKAVNDAKDEALRAVKEAEESTVRAQEALLSKDRDLAIMEYKLAIKACADFQPAISGLNETKSAIRKSRIFRLSMVLATCVIVVASVFLVGVPAFKARQDERAWKSAMNNNLLASGEYEKVLELLRGYIEQHPDGQHFAEASAQIQVVLPGKIEEREWVRTKEKIGAAKGDHLQVIGLCRDFIAHYKDSSYVTEAKLIIDDSISQSIEQDWNALRTYVADPHSEFSESLKMVDDFIQNHKSSSRLKGAEDLKAKLVENQYLSYMEAGKSSEIAKDWESAAASYGQAGSLNPRASEPSQALKRVETTAREDQFEEAMSVGVRAEARKDWESATAAYERAVSLNSRSSESRQALKRVETAVRKDRYEEAMSEGIRAEARKDWDSAIEAYKRADQFMPRSDASVALKRSTIARTEFKVADLRAKANEAETSGDWVDAREANLEIQRIDPRDRKSEEALIRIDKAELNAEFIPIIAKARKAVASRDWVSARELYEQALELKPHDPETISEIANLSTYELPAGSVLQTFEGHQNAVSCVAFTLDGKQIISGSDDTTIKLWNAYSGAIEQNFEGIGCKISTVVAHPDGKHFLSGGVDGILRLWDLNAKERGRFLQLQDGGTTCFTFIPNTQDLILTGGMNGLVRVLNIQSGRYIALNDPALSLTSAVLKGIFGQDGRGKSVYSHSEHVNALAVSHDGNMALSAGAENSLKLWNLDNNRLICSLKGHVAAPLGVSFSPDGLWALSGASDNLLCLWDIAAQEIKTKLVGHNASVTSVAFSPDGRFGLSGSMDGSVKLWDLTSGISILTLEGHTAAVQSVAFSLDGRYALSASGDRTLKLWKLWDGSKMGNHSNQ